MDSDPFVDCYAFSKAASAYIPFSTQSDAMLASLFLCYQMPRRFMDIVISIITRPNFDAKQVTLSDTVGIMKIAEQARLKERLADAHRRSLDSDGQISRTYIPEVILDGVLDVLHTEREYEVSSAAGKLGWSDSQPNKIEAGTIFSTMSLVHRSWTFPAQKALGRILRVHDIQNQYWRISSRVYTSIYGPWTTRLVLRMYVVFPNEHRSAYDRCMEAWYRFLLRFTTIKHLHIKVNGAYGIQWTQSVYAALVRQNPSLEELDLQGPDDEWLDDKFISLDVLVQNLGILKGLRCLNVHRGRLSLTNPYSPTKEIDLSNLRRLSYNCESGEDIWTLTTLLSTLSSSTNMQLDTFSIVDIAVSRSHVAAHFDPGQSAAAWEHVRKLRIVSARSLDLWIGKTAPLCGNLSEIHLRTLGTSSPDVLTMIPPSIQRLEIRLTMPRLSSDYSTVNLWAISLSSVLDSKIYTDLRSVTFEVPNCGHEFTGDIGEVTKQYKDDMCHYAEALSSICSRIGAQFTLDWEQRGLYALPEMWEADADEQGWTTEDSGEL